MQTKERVANIARMHAQLLESERKYLERETAPATAPPSAADSAAAQPAAAADAPATAEPTPEPAPAEEAKPADGA